MIDLATPLGASVTNVTVSPLSFSFTDGVQTITNNSTFTTEEFIQFSTDASGVPNSWIIDLVLTTGSEIFSTTFAINPPPLNGITTPRDEGFIASASGANSIGFNTSEPGTWTVTTTPLPAALPLFASGLGALGLLGWRRKRKQAA